VKRLRGDPQIDARGGQRGRLRRGCDAAKVRVRAEAPFGRSTHGVVRLDADDCGAPLEQRLAQNPRSRTDIGHHRPGGKSAVGREQLDRRRRIARAIAAVVLGTVGEALGGPHHLRP